MKSTLSRGRFCCAAILIALTLGPAAFGQAETEAIFVANNGNLEGSVTAFNVAPDGTLTFVNRIVTGTRPTTSQPCPGCNAYEISISPNGKYLAVGHAPGVEVLDRISIFEIAPDASITLVGGWRVVGTPLDVQWLTDDLLASTQLDPSPNNVAVWRFDPAGPSLTEVWLQPVGTFSAYLAIHPTQPWLYVNDSGAARTLRVFAVNETTGELSLLDSFATGSLALELDVPPNGERLYAMGGISDVNHGWDIGPQGGLTSLPGSPWPAPDATSNVDASEDSEMLFIGHSDGLVRSALIDPQTGEPLYTGFSFNVGFRGTIGDVRVLDDVLYVSKNSTLGNGEMGVYPLRIGANGELTLIGGVVSTQGIAPRGIAAWTPLRTPGDLNCDGFIDNEDIDPFVLAVTQGQAAYQAAWPNCNFFNGDINGDGFVDNEDIDPFVALITGP